MNAPANIKQIAVARSEVAPTYLVDNHATLIIRVGDTTLNLCPADALELLKFVERTGYQAHANTVVKGGAA